jgi:hypothetical protein
VIRVRLPGGDAATHFDPAVKRAGALGVEPIPPAAGGPELIYSGPPRPEFAPPGPECRPNRLLDNLSLFAGLDGSKGPEDLGVNANFGLRGGVNWGVPLLESIGLGAQVGTAINYSRTAVGVLPLVTGTHDRTQSFTTVGLFQRSNIGLNWGLGYDFLFEDYYKSLHFSQWRGQVGFDVTANDEVGVWGTLRDRGDSASLAGLDLALRPMDQANLFWRHVWGNGTATRIWVGMAEGHGRFILKFGQDNPSIHHPLVFGADVFVPLTQRLSLYGEANFVTPNDSGTVTATFGFAFYPGKTAEDAARSRFAPLLPVANNPTFAVDLRRQ